MKWLTLAFASLLGATDIAADFGASRWVFDAVGRVPWGDKLAHFVLLGIMSLLLNLTLGGATVRLSSVRLLKGSAILLVVVTLEEFSQAFLPYRSFEVADLAFNYAGIFCFGWLAVRLMERASVAAEDRPPLAEAPSTGGP